MSPATITPTRSEAPGIGRSRNTARWSHSRWYAPRPESSVLALDPLAHCTLGHRWSRDDKSTRGFTRARQICPSKIENLVSTTAAAHAAQRRRHGRGAHRTAQQLSSTRRALAPQPGRACRRVSGPSAEARRAALAAPPRVNTPGPPPRRTTPAVPIRSASAGHRLPPPPAASHERFPGPGLNQAAPRAFPSSRPRPALPTQVPSRVRVGSESGGHTATSSSSLSSSLAAALCPSSSSAGTRARNRPGPTGESGGPAHPGDEVVGDVEEAVVLEEQLRRQHRHLRPAPRPALAAPAPRRLGPPRPRPPSQQRFPPPRPTPTTRAGAGRWRGRGPRRTPVDPMMGDGWGQGGVA